MPVRDIAIHDLEPIDGNVRTQGRLDAEQVRELIIRYEKGDTIARLATRFGIDRTTVMRHLDKAGTETRYRARPLQQPQLDEAIRLYAEGSSLAAIAAGLDVSSHVINRELRSAGVEIRPRGFQ